MLPAPTKKKQGNRMGGINVKRWFAGGVVAGVVFFVLEGLLTIPTMDRMDAALKEHGLVLNTDDPIVLLWALVLSVIMGLVLVFFYAAARTRFGPGVRTAAIVGVVLFCSSYLLNLIGYHLIGLYPDDLLLIWSVQGLVEMIVASIAGAWVYREADSPQPRA
jgi:drug/metabolite transporter (DMT)-like permease